MRAAGRNPMKPTTFTSSRLRRVFLEGFTAMDLAEPLASFDHEADSTRVREFMMTHDFDLVGIRCDGVVAGYVRRDDLGAGICGNHLRAFVPGDDLVAGTANLIEVVRSLAINAQCFVTILDQVGGIVTLSDLEKPPMRMFLFGMITLGEMLMTDLIRHRYPDESWRSLISQQRCAKAIELQQERRRRGQNAELLECLQYGDKGLILSRDEEVREALGQKSRRDAIQSLKELETLRNNLAHTQEIIPTGWRRIIIACSRFERNLEMLAESRNLMVRPQETESSIKNADPD
jgi:hypothetical protein